MFDLDAAYCATLDAVGEVLREQARSWAAQLRQVAQLDTLSRRARHGTSPVGRTYDRPSPHEPPPHVDLHGELPPVRLRPGPGTPTDHAQWQAWDVAPSLLRDDDPATWTIPPTRTIRPPF